MRGKFFAVIDRKALFQLFRNLYKRYNSRNCKGFILPVGNFNGNKITASTPGVSCYTIWVSIEPYPTPNLVEQSLGAILKAVSFTDRIIFGRTNYNKVVSAYKDNKRFYNKCAEEVIAFCEKMGIQYHIKNKTQTKE